MVSTFTPNVQLEEPARGDDVGVWDVPVNNNMTLVDLLAGGIATISLNNSNVTLSAGQFQSKTLTFNSTLGANVQIVFPSSFKKTYEVQNLCTGSSQFTITLTTTTGGQAICCPPGEIIDCVNDGSNIKFKNFGRVGEYWDYAGSSIPNWVSGCSVPPYLQCNGTSFSSASYPALAAILGSTTTPDQRGRTRIALDQGLGRVSSAVSNVPGNTLFGSGGDQQSQFHSHVVVDPGHTHGLTNVSGNNGATQQAAPQGGNNLLIGNAVASVNAAVTGISINNALFGNSQNMPPVLVHGITMIRAA